jgi:hypothetical protein
MNSSKRCSSLPIIFADLILNELKNDCLKKKEKKCLPRSIAKLSTNWTSLIKSQIQFWCKESKIRIPRACWDLKRLHYFGDVYLTKKNEMQRNW